MASALLVLLVDDDPAVREIYAEALAEAGLRVETADDGAQAVAKGLLLQPAVIVMDFDMPRLNGLAAIRLLKQDPRTSAIPVILCTSDPLEEEARLAGCAAFIRKPCSLRQLVDTVQSQL
jgi:CheY-like chemotaxis protein